MNYFNVKSDNIETLPADSLHICPKHEGEPLTLVLKGGAGWCARCQSYQQSANHPMPALDPAFIERREQAMAEARRVKRNTAAKARRTAKQSRGSVTTAA